MTRCTKNNVVDDSAPSSGGDGENATNSSSSASASIQQPSTTDLSSKRRRGPAAAAAKSSKKRVLPPPAPLVALPPAGRFDILPIDNVRDILQYLDPKELMTFTMTCRANNDPETTPPFVWSALLISQLVDPFGDYVTKLTGDVRARLEAHHGPRRVVCALMSPRCSSCGKGTQNFEVLSCSRACIDCWRCTDSGSKGISSASPFSLCALGFATTHYLLSDKELRKELLVLDIVDETKAHGLISSKMSILLANKARSLAELKYGGPEGLAAEKTKRAAKSLEGYDAKLKVAKENGTKLPSLPDCVRKEREKETPQHWNFVCANQSSGNMMRVSETYGYNFTIAGPTPFVREPSLLVTLDSIESVRASHPSLATAHSAESPTIFRNLVDALAAASAWHTVLVDMPCDMQAMLASCDRVKCDGILSKLGNLTVGQDNQIDTILLPKSIQLVGTPRGIITYADNALFWVSSHQTLSLVDLEIKSGGSRSSNNPCIVNTGGRLRILGCRISSRNNGKCLFVQGHTIMRNSILASREAMYGGCVVLNKKEATDSVLETTKLFDFVGNTFVCSWRASSFIGWGGIRRGFLGPDAEGGAVIDDGRFIKALQKMNREEVVHDGSYYEQFEGGYESSLSY